MVAYWKKGFRVFIVYVTQNACMRLQNFWKWRTVWSLVWYTCIYRWKYFFLWWKNTKNWVNGLMADSSNHHFQKDIALNLQYLVLQQQYGTIRIHSITFPFPIFRFLFLVFHFLIQYLKLVNPWDFDSTLLSPGVNWVFTIVCLSGAQFS